jgi:hypothetical protein
MLFVKGKTNAANRDTRWRKVLWIVSLLPLSNISIVHGKSIGTLRFLGGRGKNLRTTV